MWVQGQRVRGKVGMIIPKHVFAKKRTLKNQKKRPEIEPFGKNEKKIRQKKKNSI